MSHGTQKAAIKSPARIAPNKPFSYRVPQRHSPAFNDIVAVSLRTKASILHESLDVGLPVLESRYAPQLKKLRMKKAA